MYTYQKTSIYFAQHADGMTRLVAKELRELSATRIKPAFRGTFFKASPEDLYRINYHTQLISRILAQIITFDCHSDKYLYNTAKKIKWQDFMSVDSTFAVFSTVSESNIDHSKYAALRLKDAIVDYFRDECGDRPNIDTRNPDVWINLHIHDNRAAISIDTSGGSLHRRGYRTESVEAPMQETVAAAIIRACGWSGTRPLYDPMCGSGTLLAEAMLHYCRIPAGTLRGRFGFECLPDFDASLWEKVKSEASAAQREMPDGLIAGSDIASSAVEASRTNLMNLPGGERIQVNRNAFTDLEGFKNTVFVFNPPYGHRLGKGQDLSKLYRAFGDYLKQRCSGCEAYVYYGDPELLKHAGLGTTWKKELKNGGIEGLLVKYLIY